MILADLLNKIQPHVIGWIYNMISTGWISDSDTWVYVSATQLKIVGKDVRSRFPVGTKLRLTQGTVKYFYAIAAAMSGSDTLITLTGGSDYALANAAITSPSYSYAACPQGFPGWFNYDCKVEGDSGSKGTYAELVSFSRFAMVGRTLHVAVRKTIENLGSWSGIVYVSYPFPIAPPSNANRPSFNGVIYAHATAPNTPKAILHATATSANPPSGVGMPFLRTVQTAYIEWSHMAVRDIIAIDDTREIP